MQKKTVFGVLGIHDIQGYSCEFFQRRVEEAGTFSKGDI